MRHIVKYKINDVEYKGLILKKQNDIVVPSGYTQLTYLGSNGTQWIDTGITVNTSNSATIKTEVDFNIVSPSSAKGIFGIGNDEMYGTYFGASAMWDNYNDDLSLSSIPSVTIGPINIVKEAGNTNVRVGSSIYTLQRQARSFNTTGTIYLFRKSGASRTTGNYRFYYFKCWNDGVNLSSYFVPAKRNSDGVLGMYDVVSNQFFTNAGTSTFLEGETISAKKISAIKTKETN